MGTDDVVGVQSQELTTGKSFVLRPLPHVGLNSLMSMKRSVSTSPCSVVHRSWLSDSKMVPCVSVSLSPIRSHVLITSRTSVTDSKSKSELCSSSGVALASELLKSASVQFANMITEPVSTFLSNLAAITETSSCCSEHFRSAISTDVSSELLKLPTMPSVVATPVVDSVFVATSTPALETSDENFVTNLGIVSASSAHSMCSADRKTSTPAKRPQSLDVIPWGSLSPSACTLTRSLSTVVHSRVTSSSSISAATEVIPEAPVNIPAV